MIPIHTKLSIPSCQMENLLGTIAKNGNYSSASMPVAIVKEKAEICV
jgi:hypothetical protein